jgi:glycosyltransferase involved in cell wall biosynthesis
MKMKILVSSPYFLPNVSGITYYVDKLAKGLVDKKHEVTILTTQHKKELLEHEKKGGIEIIRLKPIMQIGKGLITPAIIWRTPILVKNNEVIICNLPQIESAYLALWAKILGKKIILIHHTDLSFWPGIKNKIIDSSVFVSQFLAGLMANVITPYTDDYAKNSYFLKYFLKKVESIYPPIDFKSKKYKSIKRKKIAIGFSGRIAKQKGLEILIKSCNYLDKLLGKNKYVIKLAGPTKVIGENYLYFLNKKYKKRLKNNFIFLGNIEREKLDKFYQEIDVLVLPSDDKLESFGWVQIEAMICDTPCVVTNLPGMRIPIIKTGIGELFENQNSQDLAQKIVKVVGNRKKYINQKNKEKLLKEFDCRKTINTFEKLILLNDHKK